MILNIKFINIRPISMLYLYKNIFTQGYYEMGKSPYSLPKPCQIHTQMPILKPFVLLIYATVFLSCLTLTIIQNTVANTF